MLKQSEFRLLTLVAVVTPLVALVNMFLFSQNRERQTEIGARGQYVQQSVQLEGLYREIAKALADLAVRNNDKELRDMLAAQGISLTVNPPPPVPAATADARTPGVPAPAEKKGGK